MSTPNPLTRIEREANEWRMTPGNYRSDSAFKHIITGKEVETIYGAGATREHARAAPVVKALEDLIADFHVYYDAEYAQADWYNNNTPHVGQTIPYASYPRMPKCIEDAKQILETYKADV
jgi:hypothetical protein